jgi:uncharacterized heparinase superfamily protein
VDRCEARIDLTTVMVTLSRLRRMTLAEIAYRGRQEAAKWIDRIAPTEPETDPRSSLSRWQDKLLEGSAVVQQFIRTRASSLVGPETPDEILKRWPDHARKVIAAADQICSGRFSLLGYEGLSFGDPVDWHLDPVAGQRAPVVHWSRIDPLDASVVGDSKVIWELNRHQWLVTLGQAYRFTRDERYAEQASALLESWLDANPRGRGVNWSSSLELAYRAIAWTWAIALLSASPVTRRLVFARVGISLGDHGAHIERYLSTYFSPNTHLTGEALGLFYIGVFFGSLRGAERWRELGSAVLLQEANRQVLDDGVYFEQASCYQRYTVEIYLHFLILSARYGHAVAPAPANRIARACECLRDLCWADGTIASFGDADSGWLLPLTPRRDADCTGVLDVAAAFFGRPDLAVAGQQQPESIWMLGKATARESAANAPARGSRLFPAGGYAVMRDGSSPAALQLLFDAGPLGCPISSAHGHADLLSIHCAAFGRTWITEGGTYCYTGNATWRNYFRSTAAHSTVVVDRLSQAEPSGPFSWQSRPAARIRDWQSTNAVDFADAEHDGYSRLSLPVRHRRRVLFVKPRYWIVFDEVSGQGTHHIDLRFHVNAAPIRHESSIWLDAPDEGRRTENDKRSSLDDTEESAGMWIVPVTTIPIDCSVIEGAEMPIDGWRSDAYGRRNPAPVISYSASVMLPWRVATVLLPRESGPGQPPSVDSIVAADGQLEGVVMRETGEAIRFEDQTFTIEVR